MEENLINTSFLLPECSSSLKKGLMSKKEKAKIVTKQFFFLFLKIAYINKYIFSFFFVSVTSVAWTLQKH